MKKIWKFAIPPQDDYIHLMLPLGSKIVFVGEGWIWVEGAFDGGERREALFTTHGTGHPIPSQERHVGSYRVGPFVWHIYVFAGDWLTTP